MPTRTRSTVHSEVEDNPDAPATEEPPDTDTDDNTTDPAEEPVPDDDTQDMLAYYCPGCGAQYSYVKECVGARPEAPHPPILVVSTDELKGDTTDPANLTAAPPSE